MANRFAFEFDPEDFSLPLCVTCGQVFRWKRLTDDAWVGVDGDAWFEVRQVAAGGLQVESNKTKEAFESLFRFDWSGPKIRQEILTKGPELERYLAQMPGLRLMRPSSPVETLFSFLCTPNNHLSRITGMVQALAAFGEPMEDRPELHRFPSLERISSISEVELRALGFGYRGATIPKAARAILDRGGLPFLEELRTAHYEESKAALVELPGVGPKLADCIALFALGKTEVVPIDTHIWQAASRVYFPELQGTALTDLRYREFSRFFRDRFGSLAGWAHQYLFFDNVLNWRARKAGSV